MSLIKIPISELDIVIAVDPAISEAVKACRTAIVCVGVSPLGKYFILDCWAKREGDPAVIIDRILTMASEWMPRAIGIEMVGYQKALQPFMLRAMRERGKYYPIIELKPDRNTKTVEKKNQRILSMIPFFRAGQVYVQPGFFDFIEEYENFPNTVTVDILDAASYAFRLLAPKEESVKSHLHLELKKLEKDDPASSAYWRKYHEARGTLQPIEETQLEEVSDGEFAAELAEYY
jgi:predicted phage terminase large subunit-like protein